VYCTARSVGLLSSTSGHHPLLHNVRAVRPMWRLLTPALWANVFIGRIRPNRWMELGQIAIRPDETADIVCKRKLDRRRSIVRDALPGVAVKVMVTSPIQP